MRKRADGAARRPARLTCTTPPGFTPIIMQIPRKAESFSSLSLMLRKDVHLQHARFRNQIFSPQLLKPPQLSIQSRGNWLGREGAREDAMSISNSVWVFH